MKKTLIIAAFLIVSGCTHTEETHSNETSEVDNSEVKVCTKDAKMCPDGRSVGRDPKNNCEFFACDEKSSKPIKPLPADDSVMCTADAKQCPDGSWVGRDNQNNCKFKPCPDGRETLKKKE